jgi:hypothetical protein
MGDEVRQASAGNHAFPLQLLHEMTQRHLVARDRIQLLKELSGDDAFFFGQHLFESHKRFSPDFHLNT